MKKFFIVNFINRQIDQDLVDYLCLLQAQVSSYFSINMLVLYFIYYDFNAVKFSRAAEDKVCSIFILHDHNLYEH